MTSRSAALAGTAFDGRPTASADAAFRRALADERLHQARLLAALRLLGVSIAFALNALLPAALPPLAEQPLPIGINPLFVLLATFSLDARQILLTAAVGAAL
jgi:hypothetical protein